MTKWHEKGSFGGWFMVAVAVCLIAWLGWEKYSLTGQVKELRPVAADATKNAEEAKAAKEALVAANTSTEKAKAAQSAAEASAKNWEEQAQERANAALEAQEKADKLVKELAKAKKVASAKRGSAPPAASSEHYGLTGNVVASGIPPSPKPATVTHGSEYGFVASGLQPNAVTATAPGVPVVKLDGHDVLVPDVLIQTIYCEGKPVLAAWDGDGWFVRGPAYATHEAIRAATMIREGDYWRAKGMAGKRFHPVQLDSEGKPVWVLIEEIWPELTEPFIDRSNKKGPCLLVRG